MVAQKFDFIIKLARAAGAELAEELKYDASYISRIRNGKRTPPDMDSILEQTAGFLSDRITTDGQIEIAREVILRNNGDWPKDKEEVKAVIMNWFKNPSELRASDYDLIKKIPRAKRKKSN